VAAGSPNAPYLNIGARLSDVRVQVLAPGAAIVSFHLRAGEARPSRRTAVFRREADGVWRLAHLHASSPPSI
jgi:ketosteroid isomerase-like protein